MRLFQFMLSIMWMWNDPAGTLKSSLKAPSGRSTSLSEAGRSTGLRCHHVTPTNSHCHSHTTWEKTASYLVSLLRSYFTDQRLWDELEKKKKNNPWKRQTAATQLSRSSFSSNFPVGATQRDIPPLSCQRSFWDCALPTNKPDLLFSQLSAPVMCLRFHWLGNGAFWLVR